MKRLQLKKVYKTLRRMLIEVKMKKVRSAFTLAEVLITLGIIGVVAALTLPSAIADYKQKRDFAIFKKSLSTLSNAGRMAKAKYDVDFGNIGTYVPAQDIDHGSWTEHIDAYTEVECIDPKTDKLENGQASLCAIINSIIAGVRYNPINSNDYTPDKTDVIGDKYSRKIYQLNTGAYFGFADSNHFNCNSKDSVYRWSYNCTGFIDVNGPKGPNKIATCMGEVMDYDPQDSSKLIKVKKDTTTYETYNSSTGQVNMTEPCSGEIVGDIFPVKFIDDMVLPYGSVSRAVVSK